MSAATQLHSRMAEYFVEYRYPASYLDCLREELSQFIYHYFYHFITFITLNKTKNTCFELRSLLVGEVFKDWNSACAPLLIYYIQFRLHQNWCKTNHFDVQIASNWYKIDIRKIKKGSFWCFPFTTVLDPKEHFSCLKSSKKIRTLWNQRFHNRSLFFAPKEHFSSKKIRTLWNQNWYQKNQERFILMFFHSPLFLTPKSTFLA